MYHLMFKYIKYYIIIYHNSHFRDKVTEAEREKVAGRGREKGG